MKQRNQPDPIEPLRTLTVTSGRDTIGFIHEFGRRRFEALLAVTGEVVGTFTSTADAAQPLSNAAARGKQF